MDGWEVNFSSSWFGREFRLKIIKLLPSSFVAGVKILKKRRISGHFKLDSPYTPSVTESTQKLPNDLSFPKHFV